MKNIPIEELLFDKKESLKDIEVCKIAIARGVLEYSGGRVHNRLATNIKIIEKIDAEIKRRLIGGEK